MMIETRYRERTGLWHTPGGRRVTFWYREDTNDWNTLTASLDQDEYELPQDLTGRAVDVGGYLGSVGIALAKDNPGLTVTIIEPVPYNADLIARNIELNEISDRVALVQGAVGEGIVTVDYHFRGTQAAEHHAFVGNSTVAKGMPCVVSEWTMHNGIDLAHLAEYGTDFLKIDCEGGEWPLFAPSGGGPFRVIVGEAHAVDGHVGGDIVGLLNETHDVTLSGDPETTCGFRAVLR